MTVLEIVEAYLRKENFDGLYNEMGECSCELADLVPCGSWGTDCMPGIKAPCDGSCGEKCDLHIVKKPTK